MKKQEINKGKETESREEKPVMEEIRRLRTGRQPERDRLEAFDQAANPNDAKLPQAVTLTAIHPDGMTSLTVTTTEELALGLAALYSDGHGDFGQYSFPSEGQGKKAGPGIDERGGAPEQNDLER